MKYLVLLILAGCGFGVKEPFITLYKCVDLPDQTRVVAVTSYVTAFDTNANSFSSELNSCLDSPHKLADAPKTPIYSVEFYGVKKYDVLMAGFSEELTNEMPVGAFIGWYIEVVKLDDPNYVYRTPKHGYNCLPMMHHCVIQGQIVFPFTVDGDYKLTVIAYSAIGNFDFLIESPHLQIEQGYGNLSGVVLRQ